jgi:hypothetical protein
MVTFAFALPDNFCFLLNPVASSKYGDGKDVMQNAVSGPFVFPILFGFLIVISVLALSPTCILTECHHNFYVLACVSICASLSFSS